MLKNPGTNYKKTLIIIIQKRIEYLKIETSYCSCAVLSAAAKSLEMDPIDNEAIEVSKSTTATLVYKYDQTVDTNIVREFNEESLKRRGTINPFRHSCFEQ